LEYPGQLSKLCVVRFNLKHGQGVETYPSGERFEGNWEDGKRSGYGTTTYPGGRCYTAFWSGYATIENLSLTKDATSALRKRDF
jgi:hypothetical protein